MGLLWVPRRPGTGLAAGIAARRPRRPRRPRGQRRADPAGRHPRRDHHQRHARRAAVGGCPGDAGGPRVALRPRWPTSSSPTRAAMRTFVERLRKSLAERDKDVWVDREDIGPAVEWRREIELGIEGVRHLRLRHLAGRAALRGLRPGARPRGGEEEADRPAAAPRARRGRRPRGPRQPQLRPLPHRRRNTHPASPRCSRRSTTCLNGRASTRGCSSGPRSGSTPAARAARCCAVPICARRRHGSAEQAAHKEPQPTPLQAEYILASRTAATTAPVDRRRGGGRRGSDRRDRDRRRPSASRRPARPRAAGADRAVAAARRRGRPPAPRSTPSSASCSPTGPPRRARRSRPSGPSPGALGLARRAHPSRPQSVDQSRGVQP